MYTQFNTLADHPHIPEEAFLFLPRRAPSEQRDDFRIGEGKGIRRLLFEGWAVQTYTPYQLQKLKEFEEYAQRKGIRLDPLWNRPWKMRFLLSTGCNPKKCLSDMEAFLAYQQTVKELTLTKQVAQRLREGLFYVAGRDAHYRPLLVFDVAKIVGAEIDDEGLVQALGYFCEYVMRHLLIPGQVQNWVVIIDVAQTGVFSLVSSMKRAFSFLSDTFRSRMFACYVVRIPSSISFIWGIVKKFLQEETVRKINFFDEQTIEPLLQYCAPGQLERKFGGTLPDIGEGHFWPPRQVSTDYKCQKEPIKLLSKQEYTDLYNKRVLYDTKFHEELILPEPSSTSAQLRDNPSYLLLKKMEKEFKIGVEGAVQDSIDLEKEVVPYCKLTPTLNFSSMLAKNKTRSSLPN